MFLMPWRKKRCYKKDLKDLFMMCWLEVTFEGKKLKQKVNEKISYVSWCKSRYFEGKKIEHLNRRTIDQLNRTEAE